MCGNREKMWAGYKAAIEKQKALFRKEPAIRALLNKKLRQMRHSYGVEPLSPWERVLNELEQFYRKKTPWPIQQAIAKIALPASGDSGRDNSRQ